MATALLGTERRPPARPPASANGDALGRALGELPWDDAEGALLGAAAIVTGFRAAGWQPPVLDEDAAPSPAPHDERPLCSPGADAILARLLDGGPSMLLPEWLRLARAAGVRPAPEQLPALLDAGSRASLRTAIVQVGGDRLRWLAAFDERWSWATAGAAADAGTEERWQTGTRDERLELLRAVRAQDPERGRELLVSTWAADGAQDRATLLAALADGLAPADEPFLEAALDDRSKLVRRAGGRAARGPAVVGARGAHGAAAAAAGRASAAACVAGSRCRRRPSPTTRRGATASTTPDGRRARTSACGAWRLAQLVGAAPLSVWRELTGKDAAATYALAARRRPRARAEARLGAGGAAASATRRGRPSSPARPATRGCSRRCRPGAADDVALALLGGATDAARADRDPRAHSRARGARRCRGRRSAHLVRTLALRRERLDRRPRARRRAACTSMPARPPRRRSSRCSRAMICARRSSARSPSC